MKYVLDTNIFNRLLDGKITLSTLPCASEFIVTNVQLAELMATKESKRRNQLLQVFRDVAASPVLTESFVLDMPGSGFDESKWNSDDEQRITSLRGELDSLKKKDNNFQDAIIAEVAIANGYGLITADKNLADVATQHNIPVCHIAV